MLYALYFLCGNASTKELTIDTFAVSLLQLQASNVQHKVVIRRMTVGQNPKDKRQIFRGKVGNTRETDA